MMGLFCLNIKPVLQTKIIDVKSVVSANQEVAKTGLTDYFVDKAFAQEEGEAEGEGEGDNEGKKQPEGPAEAVDLTEKLRETIVNVSILMNRIFNPFILFFTKHIGTLLSNEYIYGGGMGEMLHKIWVVSRNIVNIVFVLILLFLAVRHIFAGEENTDLKKTLPKFVIMLIAINFSWMASRIVLDAANVATNVVFAIPSGVKGALPAGLVKEIEGEGCKIDPKTNKPDKHCTLSEAWMPFDSTRSWNMYEKDCKTFNVERQYEIAYPKDRETEFSELTEAYSAYKTNTFCWKNIDLSQYARTNAAYHLTYNMASVQNLPQATPGDTSKIGIGTLMAVFIQLVYVVAFLALFIAENT